MGYEACQNSNGIAIPFAFAFPVPYTKTSQSVKGVEVYYGACLYLALYGCVNENANSNNIQLQIQFQLVLKIVPKIPPYRYISCEKSKILNIVLEH